MNDSLTLIPSLLKQSLAGNGIEPAALEDALHAVLSGDVDEVQTAGLLVALASRPVSSAQLAAAARVLRARCVAFPRPEQPLVDTCGTGGDGAGTFNISTAAALVVAACGARVAKHGNRGVSSPTGSADVIAASGGTLDLDPAQARAVLDATGFVFLFAPRYHPAIARVAPVRKRLGVRTIFNLLGPLANPARSEYQLLGVYDPSLTRVVAEALAELGSQGALVVHCAGLDEIGLHGVTVGHRLRDGQIEPYRLDPRDLGLHLFALDKVRGGDAVYNAELMRAALGGEPNPRREVVALNAAAALEVAGVVPTLRDGLQVARELLARGAAVRVLEQYVEASCRPSREAG